MSVYCIFMLQSEYQSILHDRDNRGEAPCSVRMDNTYAAVDLPHQHMAILLTDNTRAMILSSKNIIQPARLVGQLELELEL